MDDFVEEGADCHAFLGLLFEEIEYLDFGFPLSFLELVHMVGYNFASGPLTRFVLLVVDAAFAESAGEPKVLFRVIAVA